MDYVMVQMDYVNVIMVISESTAPYLKLKKMKETSKKYNKNKKQNNYLLKLTLISH